MSLPNFKKTFKTGFEPITHQWFCKSCEKDGIESIWTITINPKDPLDLQRLTIAELQVTMHVLKYTHEITHKTKNEVFKSEL